MAASQPGYSFPGCASEAQVKERSALAVVSVQDGSRGRDLACVQQLARI